MHHLILAFVIAAAALPAAADSLRIVEDGQRRSFVRVNLDASPQVRDAAQMLCDYIRQASGADMSVTDSDVPNPQIHLAIDPSIIDLDGDGYIIDVKADGITITATTGWGIEFGVYEFLERYVGVRWLMPGPDGDDVPVQRTIDVPLGVVRDEPAFFSRLMSGYRGTEQATWARRNRMHGRVQFHHNLLHVFPPSKYTQTHPEFYPIRRPGEARYMPPTDDTEGWQPCFSNPDTVTEAIKNICAYFDEHPQAESYSLGTNDSRGFCHCDACMAIAGDRKNYLGFDDMSEIYYDWCNRVIEGVLAKYPDKYFGCLAYYDVAEPPSTVKVHPRLIPYLTYDRMQYAYEPTAVKDRDITRAWAKVSPSVGWYDYIYGTPYLLPRVWFHTMADYYRFGRDNAVRALYAEAYPNFGEGPKLWLAFKLQWNPDRDVDALLDEWYTRAVGEKAAPHLAAYYAHWEDFWTRRVHDSPWFSKKGTTYLRFSSPQYLGAVTPEDMAMSRTWLEAAVADADTGKRKQRATLLLRAFEYYEASFIAYFGDTRANAMPLETRDDALNILDYCAQVQVMAEKRHRLLDEDFADHPVLQHPLSLDQYSNLGGKSWGATGIWRLAPWIKRDDVVRERVTALATNAQSPSVRAAAQGLLLAVNTQRVSLAGNDSFEAGTAGQAEGWSYWLAEGVGRIARDERAARTGATGLVCEGVARGGPHMSVPVTPGRYAAIAWIRVPEALQGAVEIDMCMTRRNAADANLHSPSVTIHPTKSGWQPITLIADVPEKVGDEKVTQVLLLVFLRNLAKDDVVYIDDVSMYRLDDASSEQ